MRDAPLTHDALAHLLECAYTSKRLLPPREQRARLDEILLPCTPAVRRLADAAWKNYCKRHRDLTYVRASRR